MTIPKQTINKSLLAAGLIVAGCAQPALAGYKATLSTAGVGKVEASLSYITATNKAITPENYTKPSAGVTGLGTNWTVKVPQPAGTPLVCTSTVSTVYLTGGWKALARSWVTTGVTADNPELKEKLKKEQFQLIPNYCGAGYDISSGDEIIDGKRYLVVRGNATAGTAAWFRGYVFEGTPTSSEDIIKNGTKLYEALVKGPFDFGEAESTNSCQAMKVPIEYAGTNLYLVSDGIAESETDLGFINCPESFAIGCSDPLAYPALQTSGGCGTASVTYDPPVNALPPGGSVVTATATDLSGNVATCQFTVVRPFLQFNGFYSPINGSGGACAAPIRFINAGNKVPIKFDTSFCGLAFKSALPPTVTIRRLTLANPSDPCEVVPTSIDHLYFQWVANQWHFNWNTLVTDKGRYRIEVDLGDGSINPYAIVELR